MCHWMQSKESHVYYMLSVSKPFSPPYFHWIFHVVLNFISFYCSSIAVAGMDRRSLPITVSRSTTAAMKMSVKLTVELCPDQRTSFPPRKWNRSLITKPFPNLAIYHATSPTFRMPAAPSCTCGLRRTKSRGSPFWLRLQPCRSCALELRSILFRASRNWRNSGKSWIF